MLLAHCRMTNATLKIVCEKKITRRTTSISLFLTRQARNIPGAQHMTRTVGFISGDKAASKYAITGGHS